MLNPDDDSDDAVRKIAALNNLPFQTAEEYYFLMGDIVPPRAEDGRFIVYDQSGKELARLVLPVNEDFEHSDEAIRQIAALNNLPVETAKKHYWLVGDTRELAEDGRVVVYDESGTELARLILPVDED